MRGAKICLFSSSCFSRMFLIHLHHFECIQPFPQIFFHKLRLSVFCFSNFPVPDAATTRRNGCSKHPKYTANDNNTNQQPRYYRRLGDGRFAVIFFRGAPHVEFQLLRMQRMSDGRASKSVVCVPQERMRVQAEARSRSSRSHTFFQQSESVMWTVFVPWAPS